MNGTQHTVDLRSELSKGRLAGWASVGDATFANRTLGDTALRRRKRYILGAGRLRLGQTNYLALKINQPRFCQRYGPQCLDVIIDALVGQGAEQCVMVRDGART